MIPRPAEATPDSTTILPFDEYDFIIVSFSGGKDSMGCYLHLLDQGVPPERIELWHQAVDGEPGVAPRLWDWPCTESYCKAFAETMGSPILFQWKQGGYLREMTKVDELTALTTFETLDGGRMESNRGRAAPGTRMHFPLPTKDLKVRWCSAALKIDVAHKVFTTDPRFTKNTKSLILTGERREESGNAETEEGVKLTGRAMYAEAEIHKASSITKTREGKKIIKRWSGKGRRVDTWRPMLGFEEREIWELIEKYRVIPHPAYSLGFSRVSCAPCIFGDEDQWATIREILPNVFDELLGYEHEFSEFHRKNDPKVAAALEARARKISDPKKRQETLAAAEKRRTRYAEGQRTYIKMPDKRFDPNYSKRRSLPVVETPGDIGAWADLGTSYLENNRDNPAVQHALELALGEDYPADRILLQPDEEWILPMGAYGHSGGPT